MFMQFLHMNMRLLNILEIELTRGSPNLRWVPPLSGLTVVV